MPSRSTLPSPLSGWRRVAGADGARIVPRSPDLPERMPWQTPTPWSWWEKLRHRLASVLGVRLGRLEQYPPRPLRLPGRYFRVALPRPAPTISVVTPSYNQGHLLEATLRSVLEQNYPALEYIVQDGGSTDASGAILAAYRSRLTHLDSTRDRGQAHALNRGFALAGGDILAYLNSDDLLLPGALAFVGNYFARHPEVDVVYGHRVIVDADGREVGRWVLPPHCDRMLGWADFVPQETLFWRRRIWERAGGGMDESFRFALDWDLLLRFRKAGARMVRLPRFLGAFRIHEAQKTSRLLATLGEREMARLRRRTQGRDVTKPEIRNGLVDYLLRHVWYQRLHELGLLRH